MSFPQFEGFRFSVNDHVIIKATNTEGRITQCRYEIVSNTKGEFTIATTYQVNYGGYLSKTCKEDEIKYKLDLTPEKEVRVLYELIDVSLMNGNFDKVREYNEERNKLIGGKK